MTRVQAPERSAHFHVQATASTLRDGYPSFAHHDPVSALWSQKWRPPGVAGIYPFFDGSIEDFDPVFDALIRLSGDDPAFLNEPDQYAAPFLPVAADLVARAEAAMSAGRRDDARTLYLREAAVYRIARYPIVRVATGGTGRDLIARGDRHHMGDPGAEKVLTQWLDSALAAGEREGA